MRLITSTILVLLFPANLPLGQVASPKTKALPATQFQLQWQAAKHQAMQQNRAQTLALQSTRQRYREAFANYLNGQQKRYESHLQRQWRRQKKQQLISQLEQLGELKSYLIKLMTARQNTWQAPPAPPFFICLTAGVLPSTEEGAQPSPAQLQQLLEDHAIQNLKNGTISLCEGMQIEAVSGDNPQSLAIITESSGQVSDSSQDWQLMTALVALEVSPVKPPQPQAGQSRVTPKPFTRPAKAASAKMVRIWPTALPPATLPPVITGAKMFWKKSAELVAQTKQLNKTQESAWRAFCQFQNKAIAQYKLTVGQLNETEMEIKATRGALLQLTSFPNYQPQPNLSLTRLKETRSRYYRALTNVLLTIPVSGTGNSPHKALAKLIQASEWDRETVASIPKQFTKFLARESKRRLKRQLGHSRTADGNYTAAAVYIYQVDLSKSYWQQDYITQYLKSRHQQRGAQLGHIYTDPFHHFEWWHVGSGSFGYTFGEIDAFQKHEGGRWRLPTREELASLQVAGADRVAVFPHISAQHPYWTGENHPNGGYFGYCFGAQSACEGLQNQAVDYSKGDSLALILVRNL